MNCEGTENFAKRILHIHDAHIARIDGCRVCVCVCVVLLYLYNYVSCLVGVLLVSLKCHDNNNKQVYA